MTKVFRIGRQRKIGVRCLDEIGPCHSPALGLSRKWDEAKFDRPDCLEKHYQIPTNAEYFRKNIKIYILNKNSFCIICLD